MKNNVRSFRFDDEILNLLEHQRGANLSEKFENLIRDCCFELPRAQSRLKTVNEEIGAAVIKLHLIQSQCSEMQRVKYELDTCLRNIQRAVESSERIAKNISECE